LRTVAGNLLSGELVGLLEGSLVDGASNHGVLDGTVLHGNGSNLNTGAHAVLLGHLKTENTGVVDLSLGHERLLGDNAGRLLSHGCASGLLIPAASLLLNGNLLAFLNDTTFLSIEIIKSGDMGNSILNDSATVGNIGSVGGRDPGGYWGVHSSTVLCAGVFSLGLAGVEIVIEASAGPGVVLVICWVGSEFRLLLIGTAAASELTVDDETPRKVLAIKVTYTRGKERVRVAVLSGGWYAT